MVARIIADADMHADSSDKTTPAPKHGLELHDGRMFGAHPRQVSAENLKALSSLTPAPSPLRITTAPTATVRAQK